ncbi:MAG TPA: glycosyltransferase [Opitutus sp.]|nr:glycosyltransferase [Opitutus sp.]
MRILLTADPLIPVPPVGYGGIERIVDALVQEYRVRGHEVALLAKSGSTCAAGRRLFWPCNRVDGGANVLRNGLALAAAVRRFQPDVVHSFARLAFLLPLFLLRRRLPKIMSYQRHTGPRQIRWANRLGGRALSFTGCSEFICAMGRPGGGTWTAIPNFVDLAKIDFIPEVPPDAPLVFLSRVESIKGPDLAIAIARRSGRRLILAGNRAHQGTESTFFDTRIAPHLGRDGIEWIGEVGDAQKNRLLGGAAALLVPIQWDEPFGIVFAEALAAGTPVITCARGATPEIVSPGKTGWFIDSLDTGVAAVKRISELDRRACRLDCEAHFSLARCADRYLELYAAAGRR